MEPLLQHHIFKAIEARSHEVMYFDDEEDAMDLTPYVKPVVKMEEEPNFITEHETQVIKLEVEKPRLVLPFGIFHIFEYHSFCSHEFAESFISLD